MNRIDYFPCSSKAGSQDRACLRAIMAGVFFVVTTPGEGASVYERTKDGWTIGYLVVPDTLPCPELPGCKHGGVLWLAPRECWPAFEVSPASQLHGEG